MDRVWLLKRHPDTGCSLNSCYAGTSRSMNGFIHFGLHKSPRPGNTRNCCLCGRPSLVIRLGSSAGNGTQNRVSWPPNGRRRWLADEQNGPRLSKWPKRWPKLFYEPRRRGAKLITGEWKNFCDKARLKRLPQNKNYSICITWSSRFYRHPSWGY